MPARKRTHKRRVSDSEYAETFLMTDGTSSLLDGQPTFENLFVARGAWPRLRRKTWDMWEEIGQTWPPAAARAFDGFTELTWHEPRDGTWPDGAPLPRCEVALADGGPSRLTDWPAYIAEASSRDLEAVKSFRTTSLTAAAEIAEHLETFEGILRVANETALTHADELRFPLHATPWHLASRHFAAWRDSLDCGARLQ